MPALFLSAGLRHFYSALTAKHRPWNRKAFFRHCLQDQPLSDQWVEQIAREQRTHSEDGLRKLAGQLYKMGEQLHQNGVISTQRWQEILRLLAQTQWAELEETLSPYHRLLQDKEFYRRSALTTRCVLRRHAAIFAKRHRLPPESAALLWKGERSAPRRWLCLFLLVPILPALLLSVLLWKSLPLWAWGWSLFTLPSVLLGGYLLAATLLNRLLPTSPLPLLDTGEGHPILVVGIEKSSRYTEALAGLERLLHTGNSASSYLLLLTHEDALLAQCAGEEEMEKQVRQKLCKLEQQYNVSIDLLVIPRTYDSHRKKWCGQTSFHQIAPYLAEKISPETEAVCILPANGILLPQTIQRLSATLFHPLFTGNALSFLYPNESPLPAHRLAKLRRVLLQKMDAPADFNGYGMLRADCLHGFTATSSIPISPRLSGETLYGNPPTALTDSPYATPRYGRLLCLASIICHPLLLWGIIHHAFPGWICLLLLALSLSDLWVSIALSFPRKNRTAIFYSRPSLIRLGKEVGIRLLLPLKGICTFGQMSRTAQYLLTLLFGCAVIASGAPFSFLGIFWIAAPILFPAPLLESSLTPMEKAACHALSKELFEKMPIDTDRLPPSMMGKEESATTPVTLGLYGSAFVSAFALGLCDHLTFRRQISALIDQLEELPVKCGLPYSGYRLEEGGAYENGTIDSYSAAIYALCLCQLETALLEYTPSHPQWKALAERVSRLTMQMDFHLLLSPSGELCQKLTPSGEQIGVLHLLCEKGGLTWFAALSSVGFSASSPTEVGAVAPKRIFSRLIAPPAPQCKGEWSPKRLRDHLLPLLLLPVPAGSPMDYGADLLIRQIPRGKRWPIRERLSQKLALCFTPSPNQFPQGSPTSPPHAEERSFSSLLRWPRLTKTTGIDSPNMQAPPTLPLRATEYCLLLAKKPHYALSRLQILQKYTPLGGFSEDSTSSALSVDALALGLIAMESAIRPSGFAQRIQNHPRCACLIPLLSTHSLPVFPTPLSSLPRPATSDPLAPPILLGDGGHGLLISQYATFSLWEQGHPLTVPQEAEWGGIGGRPTGILLRRGDQTPPLVLCFSEPDQAEERITDEAKITCTISADSRNNWACRLHQSSETDTEFRLLFCPACKPTKPLRLTTLTAFDRHRIRLAIECSASLAVVWEAEGLTDPFTHADPSPLPRGDGWRNSIFHLHSQSADGLFFTPTCILGGNWRSTSLTLRIAVASTAAEAHRRLDEEAAQASPSVVTPDLSHSDGLVLAYYLSRLFAGAPVPHHTANSHPPLHRCLSKTRNLLVSLGFPMDASLPTPLSVSPREGVEGLFHRLLTPPSKIGETPMLPLEGKIDYPDGYFHQIRGRNSRPITHTVSNPWLCLDADPTKLSLRSAAFPTTLALIWVLHSEQHSWILPDACTEVSHLPGKICLSGAEFTLALTLLPDYPLLIIELTSLAEGEMTVAPLASPDSIADGYSFWHLSDTQTLFLHSWKKSSSQVWLVGAFDPANDRIFYEIREAVTPYTYRDLLDAHAQSIRHATDILQDSHIPALPAMSLAVLSAPSPVKAILSPWCTPWSAPNDLLTLAQENTLLLPAALLIYRSVFPQDSEICQSPIATPAGSESLYLRAARAIETAMENAPETPLLPLLVHAFAKLAADLGDPAASLYEGFAPKKSVSYPTAGKDPYWSCHRSTLLCLQSLETDGDHAVDTLRDAIAAQLPSPAIEDAALLWSGALRILSDSSDKQTYFFQKIQPNAEKSP